MPMQRWRKERRRATSSVSHSLTILSGGSTGPSVKSSLKVPFL